MMRVEASSTTVGELILIHHLYLCLFIVPLFWGFALLKANVRKMFLSEDILGYFICHVVKLYRDEIRRVLANRKVRLFIGFRGKSNFDADKSIQASTKWAGIPGL